MRFCSKPVTRLLLFHVLLVLVFLAPPAASQEAAPTGDAEVVFIGANHNSLVHAARDAGYG